MAPGCRGEELGSERLLGFVTTDNGDIVESFVELKEKPP